MACMHIDTQGGLRISWSHLPGDGGYYDQDEMIMPIWEAVRQAIIMAMSDSNFIQSLGGKHGKS